MATGGGGAEEPVVPGRARVQNITVVVDDETCRKARIAWDCAIVAAARMLGCRELLSENFTHGQRIAGVQILNPFP